MSYLPVGTGSIVTFVKQGVVGTVAAQTTIATPGRNFAPLGLVLHPTTVTGFVSAGTLSIGTTAPWTDVLAGTVLTGLTATTLVLPITIVTPAILVTAGTAINANIAGVAVAGAFVFDIYLMGVYT